VTRDRNAPYYILMGNKTSSSTNQKSLDNNNSFQDTIKLIQEKSSEITNKYSEFLTCAESLWTSNKPGTDSDVMLNDLAEDIASFRLFLDSVSGDIEQARKKGETADNAVFTEEQEEQIRTLMATFDETRTKFQGDINRISGILHKHGRSISPSLLSASTRPDLKSKINLKDEKEHIAEDIAWLDEIITTYEAQKDNLPAGMSLDELKELRNGMTTQMEKDAVDKRQVVSLRWRMSQNRERFNSAVSSRSKLVSRSPTGSAVSFRPAGRGAATSVATGRSAAGSAPLMPLVEHSDNLKQDHKQSSSFLCC